MALGFSLVSCVMLLIGAAIWTALIDQAQQINKYPVRASQV
jgi:hypothetical protein